MHHARVLAALGLALGVGWSAAATAAASPPPVAAPAPRLQLDSGLIEGRRSIVDGIALDEFRGIPYAAPPVGALRWKPPQPATPWAGTWPAQHFAPRCMQLPLFSDMVFRSSGMNEDCLYLNVWSPAHAQAGKLPVLVYFYGGGFIGGDGSELRYDGASLATRGIITVTVNYRLGVFGFFALPALAEESAHHAAGNYGLLDQVAALRWVQANIARFGGDPSRVTIAGESAGSIAVSALMTSPLSKYLFARAIGESGALIAPISALPLATMEGHGEAFANKLGKPSLAALRALPADTLLQATREQNGDADVAIDGWFLTEAPEQTFQRGAQAQVPLLLGTNSQEGYYTAILQQLPPTPDNYRAALQRLFGSDADQIMALYPAASEDEVRQSATALASDIFIAHSSWRWMDLQWRHSRAPVYFYHFAQARPAKRQPAPGEQPDAGAVHSGEIEYALGNLDSNRVYAWTAADHRASATMEGYFAQFIKSGNPNGGGLPAWPAVAASGVGLLRQVIAADSRTEVDRSAARQTFLQQYFRTHTAPF